MKKSVFILIAATLCIASFAVEGHARNKNNQQVVESKGEIVYARHGFYVEKNRHITTNYGVQYCYPVNSKLEVKTVTRLFGKEIHVKSLSDNSSFTIQNVEKYTKVSDDDIMSRMFSKEPTSLAGHSAEALAAINKCRIVKGMTKDEVILARGYPPAHQTPSLEANAWQYWYKRMPNGFVHFQNGQVVNITGSVQQP